MPSKFPRIYHDKGYFDKIKGMCHCNPLAVKILAVIVFCVYVEEAWVGLKFRNELGRTKLKSERVFSQQGLRSVTSG